MCILKVRLNNVQPHNMFYNYISRSQVVTGLYTGRSIMANLGYYSIEEL
jgi:hypothetical protein